MGSQAHSRPLARQYASQEEGRSQEGHEGLPRQVQGWCCCQEKKWSKGKVREKLNNSVVFDQATYDRMMKEAANFKLITPSVLSERLKISGSLARRAITELLNAGSIKLATEKHSAQLIYTRNTGDQDA